MHPGRPCRGQTATATSPGPAPSERVLRPLPRHHRAPSHNAPATAIARARSRQAWHPRPYDTAAPRQVASTTDKLWRLDRYLTVVVGLAQDLLVELADARLRHLVDEGPPLRHPPLRHPVGEPGLQLLRRGRLALVQHHRGERSLLPALVRHPDNDRLADRRVRHQRPLELDGGDPLATALDDVLRAVGQGDVAARVDRAHVAGAQPAVVELRRVVVLVVRRSDPGAGDLELADSLAVARHHLAGIVDDATFNTEREPAGSAAVVPRGFGRQPARWLGH